MDRRAFIGSLLGGTMSLAMLKKLMTENTSEVLPTLFVGHGSPMNAIELNTFTKQMRELGTILPQPKTIVVLSAHWLTEGTSVTASENPVQIYDFFGFPEALNKHQYQPPGDTQRAQEIHSTNSRIKQTTDWGLDHGSWSVLTHLFPDQKIPVIQMSLDKNLTVLQIFELMQSLRDLRKKGVLFLGSGNLVHNLRQISWQEDSPAHPWALDFENRAIELLAHKSFSNKEKIEKILKLSEFNISHPTPEHFIPLIYNLGVLNDGEIFGLAYKGIQNASVSMASFMSQKS